MKKIINIDNFEKVANILLDFKKTIEQRDKTIRQELIAELKKMLPKEKKIDKNP